MGFEVAGLVDGSHHLRAFPRYKLFEPTDLVVGGQKQRVHMLNLSSGGALIHRNEPLAPGTRVRLRCGQNHVSGKVAWASGSRLGLAFLVPLTDDQVMHMLAAQPELAAGTLRRAQPTLRAG